MRFGDYIREVRRERDWTQPEAAKKIGIEQSYLSKLESGRSYPSEDVFSSLIAAYHIDVAEMNHQLFPAELDQLREISQVRTSLLNRDKDSAKWTQRWLFASVGAAMAAGIFFGLFLLAEPEQYFEYKYRSDGVILDGEDLRVFDIVEQDLREGMPDFDELSRRQQDMTARLDQQFASFREDKDNRFVESVPGGLRLWDRYEYDIVERASPLRWFLVPALMMLFASVGCFVASLRTLLR